MIYRFDKKKCTFTPAKDVYYKLIFIMLFILLINNIVYHHVGNEKLDKIRYVQGKTKTIIINEDNVFSEDRLKQFILELNVRFPHIVLAQAKIESGSFKSKMFIQNNNLFGMKVAKRRPTTSKGEQSGYAYFDSWKDCVVDYAFYQAAYLSDIKSEEQYYSYLSRNYAEDEKYTEKVRKFAEYYK